MLTIALILFGLFVADLMVSGGKYTFVARTMLRQIARSFGW
jgi:hypothetical protein